MTLSNALICLYSPERIGSVLTWRDTDNPRGPWDISSPKYTRLPHDVDVVTKQDIDKFKANIANADNHRVPCSKTIEKWIMDILPQAIEDAELAQKDL